MNKVITLVVSLALLPLSNVFAEGYQLNGQSAKQTGMGNAGVALKLGAESMHFNPAGLGFMDKTIDLSAGFAAIFPTAEFSSPEGGQTYKTQKKASTPIYFYGGFKIYDFLSAGVSVTNPYGSSINWGKNWPGAGLVQDISLKSFSVQPTLAFKIGDRLSLGAGMMIIFGDFSLSRALVTSADLATIAEVNPPLKPLADKYKEISPVSATLSGDAGVKMGFNVGAMFDVTDQITLGVSYRSKVQMAVNEGIAVVSYANESELKPILGNNIPPLDKGTFKAELPLPSNFTIGLSYKPMERLSLTSEVQFVGWGTYKELNVKFSQEVLDGKYSINAPKEYKNSRVYRLAGQYAATNRLDLRLGFYLDETPVKDDFLNPETPSMNKLGTAVGLSFRPTERLSVDVAFAYITGFGRDGSYTDQVSKATFGGHYEVVALNPTIGLSYSF